MTSHHDIIAEELSSILGVESESIDFNASFVSLGGHSLSAIQWSSRCRKRGVNLPVSDIVRKPSILKIIESVVSSDDISIWQLRKDTVEIFSPPTDPYGWLDRLATAGVDFRLEEDTISTLSHTDEDLSIHDDSSDTALSSSDQSCVEDTLPVVSDLQLSLIHDSVKNPGTNIIQHFETYRPDDIPAVSRAWKAVFEQELILQTTFSNDLVPSRQDQFPWQETITSDETHFSKLVNSAPTTTSIKSSWQVFTLADSSQPPILFKSVVVWTIHHALIDGYSAQILLKRVRQAAEGQDVVPGPSFSKLSREIHVLRHQEKPLADAFWASGKERMSQAATALQLPPPASVPEHSQAYEECIRDVKISAEDLTSISKHCGVTPATLFHAAWALVMNVFADNDTICFGITLSGRNLLIPGIDEAVGAFANTLPMALQLRREMTLDDLAKSTFSSMTELSQYQWATPENGFVRNFQSILAMQFDLSLDDGTSVCPIEPPYTKQTSGVPLNILIRDQSFVIRYSRHVFEQRHIESVADVYLRAIQAFSKPQRTVDEVRVELVPPEAHQLVRDYGNCFSGTTSPSFIVEDLVTLYETTVDRNPESVAVEKGPIRLTYAEMDERVKLVAQALSAKVSPGDIVCVDADRSLDWIIAIFGVLKAGAVYCALDAGLPAHIRELNFATTGAKIFLSSNASGADRAPPACSHLTIDSILAAENSSSPCTLPRRQVASPSSNAYVCFTSGSTGKPKGVVCSHEGLVAFQHDLEVRLFAQPGTRVSQLMSPAFDGSIHEIFSAICHGATLVLPEGDNILQVLNRVTSAILTPSVANVLDPADFPDLKTVYLVGEQVKQATNDRWGAAKTLYNMYGPTEGTCGATIQRLLPGRAVTIGRPNPTTRVYILDSARRLVHPGVIGEIYLAGVQIARGYLNNQALTSERFLQDSICAERGEYMYKTGDRGYWTSEGEIMCLGRNDRQIKLRGFRLDLDDLEVRIAGAQPGLQSIALAQRDDFLVAAIQPSTLDLESVTTTVAQVLPSYAQPRHILLVDKFPLTKAGKLDYAMIVSDQFIKVSLDKSLIQTPTQAKIASIWRSLLKLDHSQHIGPKSNFLQLGGNSLLQIALLARLSSTLKVKTPLKLVIEHPSLGDIAAQIDKLRRIEQPKLEETQALGMHRLSPVERDWWLRYQLDGSTTTCFNVSYVATLPTDQSVDLEMLASAWNVVLSRHSILRGRYCSQGRGRVERRIAPQAPRVQRVQYLDVWAEVNRPFDLARSAPIRVTLSPSTLAVVLSHIVADLKTLRILLREVETSYGGHDLAPVQHVYADNVKWSDDVPICNLNFWSKHLEGHDTLSAQFFSHESASVMERDSYRGKSSIYSLPEALATTTRTFIKEQRDISAQQLVLGAVALAVQWQTDNTDIILGCPFINRSSDADAETVGLFLEPLPIRIRHTTNPDGSDANSYLDQVRTSVQSSLGHAVPWHKLLEHLYINPQYPNHPIFDVMVTFHDDNSAVSLDIPGLRPQLTWSEGSKFSVMVEFTVLQSGNIILRIEHDNHQHTHASIDRLAGAIAYSLGALVRGEASGVIKRSLQAGGGESLAVKRDAFGVPLDML
ncbi:tyrocidine synthetase 1 [Xylariaceae sp. FL1651]|nr:tyrocidine synthetase 1 [Xylariaceae sp. FL1651]